LTHTSFNPSVERSFLQIMFCSNLHNSPSSSSKSQELQQLTTFPFNRLGSGINSRYAIYEERRSESLPKKSKECDGELNKEANKRAPVGIVMRLEAQRWYVSFFISLVHSNPRLRISSLDVSCTVPCFRSQLR
jgi:hypothetical protein